jgi:hypothetical protein
MRARKGEDFYAAATKWITPPEAGTSATLESGER